MQKSCKIDNPMPVEFYLNQTINHTAQLLFSHFHALIAPAGMISAMDFS
jgi:hypothetical protein